MIVANESSSSTITDASLATSVPVTPMATPMSARLRARGIVDAVAGHRDDLAEPLEAVDDAQLVRGRDAGEQQLVAVLDRGEALRQAIVVELGELGPGEHLRVRLGDDPDLARDRLGSQPVVTGDHDDRDPCRMRLRHRFRHLGPRRVQQADEAHEHEVPLDLLGPGRRTLSERARRHREDAQRLPRELVDLRGDRGAIHVGQLTDATVGQHPARAGEDLGGRTLRVDDLPTAFLDDDRHPLALRVEGDLAQSRRAAHLRIDVVAGLGRKDEQRALGRIPEDGPLIRRDRG